MEQLEQDWTQEDWSLGRLVWPKDHYIIDMWGQLPLPGERPSSEVKKIRAWEQIHETYSHIQTMSTTSLFKKNDLKSLAKIKKVTK
jgi:hypothetical protein